MWAIMLSCTFAEMTTSTSFKYLLYAENIRNVTDELIFSPKVGRHAEEFFAFIFPTTSAGYEPANIGTKDQAANPRPPKPQNNTYDV
jgi:hypothetical protein